MLVDELMTYNVSIVKNPLIIIFGQIQTLDDNKLLASNVGIAITSEF
jgi:hypothetical protein